MKLKPGVDIRGIAPEIVLVCMIAAPIWERHGQELVVTSVCDGKHGPGSLHYNGYAIDFRTRYFTSEQLTSVAADLREALGNNPDIDIVVEGTHMHVEFQPKYRG